MNPNVKNIYLLFLKFEIAKSDGMNRAIMIRQLHSYLSLLLGVHEVRDKLLIKSV